MDATGRTLTLLVDRAPEASVCPSEVARALAAGSPGQDWRHLMPVVHAAVDQLVTDDQVWLSWQGKAMATRSGPYRIARGRRFVE
jgi:Protein of unknown function (DUF3253)